MLPDLADAPLKPGSAGLPWAGYGVRMDHEATGEEVPLNERSVLAIKLPLPPGCLS